MNEEFYLAKQIGYKMHLLVLEALKYPGLDLNGVFDTLRIANKEVEAIQTIMALKTEINKKNLVSCKG